MNDHAILLDDKIYTKIFIMFISFHVFMVAFHLFFWYWLAYTNPHGIYSVSDNYNIIYYAIDYSNGLLTRALAGQLFGFILLNFGGTFIFWAPVIKVLYSLIFYIPVALLAKKYLHTDKQLMAMIAFMFMRLSYFNSTVMYILKTDIYWYICMLPIMFLLWSDSKKRFNLKMIGVLACSAIAMLFHQAFIFVFAPLVCVILFDKQQKVWFFVYAGFLCVMFIYLTKFCVGDYDEICETVITRLKECDVWDHITTSNNMLLGEDGMPAGLYYEYGDSRSTQIYESDLLMSLYKNSHFPLCVGIACLSGLSIAITMSVIIRYCKEILVNEWKIRALAITFIAPFAALVIFTIDIDRWFMMTLTSLNVFALYVAMKYNIRTNVNYRVFKPMFILQILLFPVVSLFS